MLLDALGRARIRFDMFDLATSVDEARRAQKLGNIYHRGQDLAWNGREVLRELLDRHGGIKVTPEQRTALVNIFGTIMWGELAAWRISAQLADALVPLEAKMAATSQAHDEARHFYVMHDYLEALGEVPRTMDRPARRLLELVLGTNSLAEKLIGMQLMVETTALTIFQSVRDTGVEPVLGDLLRYFEKDEARHVGLGVQTLPGLIRRMGRVEGLRFFVFQMRVLGWSIAGLRTLAPHLRALGIDPRTIMVLGRSKQVMAYNQLWDQLGRVENVGVRDFVMRVLGGVEETMFPRGPEPQGLREQFAAFATGFSTALDDNLVPVSLDPNEAPRPVKVRSN